MPLSVSSRRIMLSTLAHEVQRASCKHRQGTHGKDLQYSHEHGTTHTCEHYMNQGNAGTKEWHWYVCPCVLQGRIRVAAAHRSQGHKTTQKLAENKVEQGSASRSFRHCDSVRPRACGTLRIILWRFAKFPIRTGASHSAQPTPVKAMMRLCQKPLPWLLFCSTVARARQFCHDIA